MSEKIEAAAAEILSGTLKVYTSAEEKAALRCALGDAAAMCDTIARLTKEANPGRKRGSVSSVGAEMADIAKRCGDAIWAMRAKVDAP